MPARNEVVEEPGRAGAGVVEERGGQVDEVVGDVVAVRVGHGDVLATGPAVGVEGVGGAVRVVGGRCRVRGVEPDRSAFVSDQEPRSG